MHHPAQTFVAVNNVRMWGSIRSVTTAAVATLVFINTQTSELLSIRNWVREGRGVLFLPYQADQIAALRTVISTWLRNAIFETMTLDSVPNSGMKRWPISFSTCDQSAMGLPIAAARSFR